MIITSSALPGQRRRGLTLTEILISILIMGIGLLSLATLFPLGLLRLREANRATRSTLLAETASSDLVATGVAFKPFYIRLYSIFYGFVFDPFLSEMAWLDQNGNPITKDFDRSSGGWPVVIDPLWIYEVEQKMMTSNRQNQVPFVRFDLPGTPAESRFGLGLGWLSNPSNAYGLRRLSPYMWGIFNPEIERRYSSIDDLIYQSEGDAGPTAGQGSPLVPVMVSNSAGVPSSLNDLSYTWFFTGKVSDLSNSLTFDGDVVVCHNRPFEFDATNLPNRTQSVAGEMTVQAIWGYGPPVTYLPGVAYSANNTTVLLRWPATQPDPGIIVGSWICDTTYSNDPFYISAQSKYPGQRCYWYRVTRRSDVRFDGGTGFNEVTVTIDRPLRAQTPLQPAAQGSAPTPLGIEPAVIMPSVVNVIPKVFTIQTN